MLPNELNKDSMDRKKQIEQLYTDALYNDEAPNVFADRILSLFSVGKSVVCGNCDGWGYTVDENGRRKDHCKQCE